MHKVRKHQTALDVLLVNRQIYTETRAITFQLHTFDFCQWCGTGIHYCRIFLRGLREWQASSIQWLILGAVETNLIHGYKSQRPNSGWLDVCEILSGVGRQINAELRELRLTISGRLTEDGAKLLDVDAEWVKIGLVNLKSLRSLEINIASDSIGHGVAECFNDRLKQTLHGVNIIIRTVRRGIAVTL